MSGAAGHYSIFAAWRGIKSGAIPDAYLSLAAAIRRAYPNHHLTRVSTSCSDLLAFAHAGHAAAERDDDGDGATIEFSRAYNPPSSRMDPTPTRLTDTVYLGRWRYAWEGVDFILYQSRWTDPSGGCLKEQSYLLAPLGPPRAGESKETLRAKAHHPETDALLLAVGDYSRELHEEVYVFDSMFWSKSKSLWRSVQSASWDDVVLDPAMKASIIADVEGFFDNREMYEMLKVPWKRGVILHGPPGNGKTVTIKALINTLARRPGTPVQSLYVKSLDADRGSKWSIQRIFQQARLVAPCLLIFEDLDSLVEDETRSYFLNEVDGLENNDGILMIGSTNHLDRLDPSVTKRPSRFDRKYHYRPPARPERLAYAEYWRNKFVGSQAIDFPEEACGVIADLTAGYSFAYMKELFITSLLQLARGGAGEEETEQAEEAAQDATGEDKAGGEEVMPVPTTDETATKEMAEKPSVSSAASDVASDTVIVAEPRKEEQAKEEGKDKGKGEDADETKGEDDDKPGRQGRGRPRPRRKAATKKKPVKRVLPEVEIPESVRDNLLLKVVKKQAGVLLGEIDHAEEEQEELKKASVTTGLGIHLFRSSRPPYCD